ncbi:hypothetical protein D3C72_2430250 [compost metagenome]
MVGRADHVVATAAGDQFGLKHLVAVDQVVSGVDTGLRGEIAQGIAGDVVAPVGDAHRIGRGGN